MQPPINQPQRSDKSGQRPEKSDLGYFHISDDRLGLGVVLAEEGQGQQEHGKQPQKLYGAVEPSLDLAGDDKWSCGGIVIRVS